MLKRIFPFLTWFENYNISMLRIDLLAGITVAIIIIPKSMAYAQLAGLPPYYGLYAAFLPPMIGALFGSSRQLATGAVAIVSLMTAALLEPFCIVGSDVFIAYAIALALLVGIFQLALGVLRLGVIVNFLAHPVILGFTNAAAIIIGTSQLSKVFGVHVEEASHQYETVINIIKAAISDTHLPTLAFALLAFAIIFILKKKFPKFPNILVAVVITTLLSWQLGFQNNIKISIEDIQSEETVKMIEDFNSIIKEIDKLAINRVELNDQLSTSEEEFGKNSIEAYDINQQIGKINLLIDNQKEKAGVYRHNLRSLKFRAIVRNGKKLYYLVDSLPIIKYDDDRVWRMKVENKILKSDSLSFSGGGAVVGDIPKGLPKMGFPKISLDIILKLFTAAIIISFIGFTEAISVAKGLASKTGQQLDPNQELIGQGLANIVGSFGQCYPVTGSFSATAVNIQAGALTGMSQVFTGCIVAFTLLFLTPLLYYLPQAVLAVIVIMAVIGLINFNKMIHIWHANKYDGVIVFITFISTLAFAPHLDKGIMVGFMLSIIFHLYQTMKPRVAELSTDTAIPSDLIDNTLQDAELYRLNSCEFITIIRFDGSLIFANTSYLEDEVLNCISAKPTLNNIIFVADGINTLDATGEEMLSGLIIRLRQRKINVSFCGLKEQVTDMMKRTDLYNKIEEKNIFNTTSHALLSIYSNAHKHEIGSDEEKNCPLKKLVYYQSFDTAKRSRVLLVDDEQNFTRVLSKRMKVREFDTTTAYDGKGALELVESEKPDVVVLDLNMPGIDGMEILKRIKTEHPKIEVIILTGHGSEEKEQLAIKIGAFAFLQKPIDINMLVKTVEDAYAKIASRSH